MFSSKQQDETLKSERSQSDDVITRRRHSHEPVSLVLFGRSMKARRRRSTQVLADDVISTSWASYDRLSVDLNGIWDNAVSEYVPSWSQDGDVMGEIKLAKGRCRHSQLENNLNHKSAHLSTSSLSVSSNLRGKTQRPNKRNKTSKLKFFNFAENKPIHSNGERRRSTVENDANSGNETRDDDVMDVTCYLDALALDTTSKNTSTLMTSQQQLPSFEFNMASQRRRKKPVTSSTPHETSTQSEADGKFRPALSPINETMTDQATLTRARAKGGVSLSVPSWYPHEESGWTSDAFDKWWQVSSDE